MIEKINPNSPPTTIPIQGVQSPNCPAKERLKTTEEKAPITMIPSNPTFTIPLLSEKVPPNAVKIRGAEYIKAEETTNCNNEIISILLNSSFYIFSTREFFHKETDQVVCSNKEDDRCNNDIYYFSRYTRSKRHTCSTYFQHSKQ